ncbi:MAG: hypothetical protein WC620_09685 [Methanoregula sp.]
MDFDRISLPGIFPAPITATHPAVPDAGSPFTNAALVGVCGIGRVGVGCLSGAGT